MWTIAKVETIAARTEMNKLIFLYVIDWRKHLLDRFLEIFFFTVVNPRWWRSVTPDIFLQMCRLNFSRQFLTMDSTHCRSNSIQYVCLLIYIEIQIYLIRRTGSERVATSIWWKRSPPARKNVALLFFISFEIYSFDKKISFVAIDQRMEPMSAVSQVHADSL